MPLVGRYFNFNIVIAFPASHSRTLAASYKRPLYRLICVTDDAHYKHRQMTFQSHFPPVLQGPVGSGSDIRV